MSETTQQHGRGAQAPAVRELSNDELAACCGGCRTNSAIETWMRRAITKFCEVNQIPLNHRQQEGVQ